MLEEGGVKNKMIQFYSRNQAILSAPSNQIKLTLAIKAYDHVSQSTVIYLWHQGSYEAAALQREAKWRENNTWVSPGASHTWSNLSFPLLTPQPTGGKKECKLSSGRGVKERRHSEMVTGEKVTKKKTCKQKEKFSIKMICERRGGGFNINLWLLLFPADGAVMHQKLKLTNWCTEFKHQIFFHNWQKYTDNRQRM